MTVLIRYRRAEPGSPMAFREVLPGTEHYARALWLSHLTPEGLEIDCAVSSIPPEAQLGPNQDPEPYCSPRYALTPTTEHLLDDEESRRRFVIQASRVAQWIRENPGTEEELGRMDIEAKPIESDPSGRSGILPCFAVFALAMIAWVLLVGSAGGSARAQETETIVAIHGTAERAAIQALCEAMAQGPVRREWAGIVYRSKAGYAATDPVKSRREGRFSLRLRPGVDFPRDSDVVALYHTHPRSAGVRADAHSPEDVSVARESGLASYLGVAESGNIRMYDPGAVPRAPIGYPRGSHRGERLDTCGGEA